MVTIQRGCRRNPDADLSLMICALLIKTLYVVKKYSYDEKPKRTTTCDNLTK